MKTTFKEFLKESPLNDYETIGDWSKGHSFTSRDRMLLQHPKAIEMMHKKFSNTNYDFNFYFVNSKKARLHKEIGVVSPQWVKDNLDPEVFEKVEKNLNNDSINIIFTNNSGAERKNASAWILAHRIGHALNASPSKSNAKTYYLQAENHLLHQFANLADYYGLRDVDEINKLNYINQGVRKKQRVTQLAMMYFFYQVATFKSARDRNIRDWFEILNELIAQYLTTGKIKFNKAPRCFGGGGFGNKQNYCCKEEHLEELNDYLEMLGRDMGNMIDDVFGSIVGDILVM